MEDMTIQPGTRTRVLSWALYDWANSAFATTVIAGFFPVFLKSYWSAGQDVTFSTFWLGVGTAVASLLVAAVAPLLGAVADRRGARKRFLLFFAAMGIVMTASLAALAQGAWLAAIAVYVAAVIGFSAANVFYDALLVFVAAPRRRDVVSALGYALGYLGGGLLFALNVWMAVSPATFGLADAGQAVRLSFLLVAGWWAIFSVPILLFVKEPRTAERTTALEAMAAAVGQIRRTFGHLRRLRVAALFLAAYWLYIDGVDTIVHMAVDYGLSIGLPQGALIQALLITQFVGFPAAIAYGWLGERIGAKAGILAGVGAYAAITVGGYFMRTEGHFYALAVAIGLVQGGVQALSRSLFSRLIPPGQSGEFFGFYNMLGKFAAVLGPLLMGVTARLTGSPRASILSVLLLFVAGGLLLLLVDVRAGERVAREA